MLEVSDLSVEFGPPGTASPVVDRLSLRLDRGESLVLVGESGSGKTVAALSLVRLLPQSARITGGRVLFDGEDLFRLPLSRMTEYRGARIGFVFQEPQTALNPVMTIGDQIGEVLTRHRGLRGAPRARECAALLDAVGIPDPEHRMRDYAHQFSGGMKQRAMLAIALAGEPDLLIADEPTTALDVTVQAQILALLIEQRERRGMGLLFITHDLAVAHRIADRIVVLKNGRVVEEGPCAQVFATPTAPYTQALLKASPRLSAVTRPRPALDAKAEALLEVRRLSVGYVQRVGLFKRGPRVRRVVDEATLALRTGETLAVVGESGSGKTTLARAITRLIPDLGGEIRFAGADLRALRGEALRSSRRDFQLIFQDPFASMNPRLTVEAIVSEGMIAQNVGGDAARRRTRIAALLEQVGLEPAWMTRYPHEFSGGQRQRVCIARALAVEPRLLVCDEPTSALDVSVQAQILGLLRDLQQRLGLSYLFITHNLGVVAEIAHRVLVMHHGRIVESGPVDQVLVRPAHPYTRTLLDAVPSLPG